MPKDKNRRPMPSKDFLPHAAAFGSRIHIRPPQNPKAAEKNTGHDAVNDGTQHSQTVGPRGPVLMQDTILHETMAEFAFSTERPRVVHQKGYGAFGFFQPFSSMSPYTSAAFLQNAAKTTPIAMRFSLAASDNSTPDTSRNIRGCSIKFYTDEGIFDLLCNSLPVFFVRDAMKVPATIAALAPSPVNNLPDPNRLWEMFANTPEATHLLVWLFSDAGTAKSFRTIPYFGVSTFAWKNAQGQRHYVKYHLRPALETAYIDQEEAARLACENPHIAGEDLYTTLAAQKPVIFDLAVQLMEPADEERLPYDPLDDTKIWDEGEYPLIYVGRLTLNHNPEHFSEQVDKLAFSPANLVEGIEFSDDKILQGRAEVYFMAQRHRLGKDFRRIPINRQANWQPDSMISSGCGRFVEGKLMRAEIPKPDNFTQAGQYYASLSQEQQSNLVQNLAAGLSGAKTENRRIILEYLEKASPELAGRVAAQMG